MAWASPSLRYWEDNDQWTHPKAKIPGGGPNSFYFVSRRVNEWGNYSVQGYTGVHWQSRGFRCYCRSIGQQATWDEGEVGHFLTQGYFGTALKTFFFWIMFFLSYLTSAATLSQSQTSELPDPKVREWDDQWAEIGDFRLIYLKLNLSAFLPFNSLLCSLSPLVVAS